MRDQLPRFGQATVVGVTFAKADRLPAHRQHLGLPFPLLADPDRTIYRRFDLGRGTRRQVWNPGTLATYARLIARGRRVRRPTEDIRQLGGDFVIGPDGTLAAAFHPQSPDDRPTIDQLIDAVERARLSGSKNG